MARWLWAVALCLQALGLQAATTSPADVLLQFAAAARGANAAALADWRNGTDPCTWTGVSCMGTTVASLHLPRARLQGSLAAELSQLTSLQQINLADNDLVGRLPARWACLPNLERLFLDRNRLTGGLPPSWNTMQSVQYLSLSGNALNGSLPVAWASLGRLVLLDLSGNSLKGGLPQAWSRQRTLIRLALARNELDGSLPREWAALRSLLQLDLGANALTGGLPAEWGRLQQATSLDLSDNKLGGVLPPAWAKMGSLQVLALQSNQLSGGIPAEWKALADRAFRISLGNNKQLCGPVPQPLQQAVLAAGSSRKGSGLASRCSWEGDATALLQFKKSASAQQQQGPLASWVSQANPCSQGTWTGVSCRDGRVTTLDLSNAALTFGSLEPLGQLTAVERILLAGNDAANASLPASWAQLGRLTEVDLRTTGIGGALPPLWAKIQGLKQLLLGGNNLNATLPQSWVALGNLTTLDVAQNALTGSLPPCWAGLASLASLDASGNYLSGALPEGWKDLATLQEIRLANNNLAGNIPPSWARLPSLMAIDLGSNVGVCGAPPEWQAGVRVHIAATNIGQSCIMVNTSSTLVGAVLGVSLGLTLASLAAVAALLVHLRRLRVQLQLLQRQRGHTSFSSVQGVAGDGGGKAFSLPGTEEQEMPVRPRFNKARMLSLPGPWTNEHDGYIQVALATPHGSLPTAPASTPPRTVPSQAQTEPHCSPSPTSGMPSPELRLWQVAAHAADRGVDLTARNARQKRLFRSQSEVPGMLGESIAADGAQHAEARGDVDMLRVHSRLALLPSAGGMV